MDAVGKMVGVGGKGGRCTQAESLSWWSRPEPLVLLIWEDERYAEGEDMQGVKARGGYALGSKKLRLIMRSIEKRAHLNDKFSCSSQTQS